MKKLFLLTFIFIELLCKAQQYYPYIEWQKCFGGSGEDKAYSMEQDSNGNFIVTGSTYSNNGNVSGNHNLTDMWTIEVNDTGGLVKQRCYGSQNFDYAQKLIHAPGNNYLVAGFSAASSNNGDVIYPIGGGDMWVLKLNQVGTVLSTKCIGGLDEDNANSISNTFDGGYIVVGKFTSQVPTTDRQIFVAKVAANDSLEWYKILGGTEQDLAVDVIQALDSTYMVYGDSYSNNGDISGNQGDRDYVLLKLDKRGNIIWSKSYGTMGTDIATSFKQTPDKGFILTGSSCTIKINSAGTIQWQKSNTTYNTIEANEIRLTRDGNYLMCGNKFLRYGSGFGVDYSYAVAKLTSNGGVIWWKEFGGNSDNQATAVIETEDGCVVAGYTLSTRGGVTGNHGDYDYWVVKLKVIENPDSITGKIFKAQNLNCLQEANEQGKPNVILKTEPKNFYGISDTAGKYTILTDTGTYKVKPIFPQILKPFLQQTVCPSIGYHTVSFSQYGQDTSEINFANYEKQCAYLQVELSQGRMRRCFNNTTAIKYCNIGNIDTTNVQVIVTLPEYVTFVSASNPNYTISGKKITFNIGALRANECGTINLITKVDCVNGITGLTQCISAYILPRNKCVDQIQPDYALWDKSEVSVDGSCTGNTARFVIKNIGQNNMTDSSSYRIYKDAVQAVNKKFKLNAGDSLVINVTATGNTYRLEADQVAHFPSASLPSVTIENCGTSTASRGFVNQMPQNTVAPDVEKICLPIRDSYDPNDKSVSPTGVGINKLVKHKVPLDYLIRFQNTGTDTAYKVVIIDTLDQNLDLSTLEFGASSHKYKIEFTGSGKPILKFTFDKINLVDSFTNEPKSHGFVSFKITPYDSIPNGTLVKNSADIYFDFNLPIKTNTTQVSIDDRLPTGATLSFVTAVKEQKNNYEAIYVYPNPFNTITNFEFVYNTKATQLIVYNINGELVANENVSNQSTYQFHRNNIANGMYFYVIQNNEGEIIGRGKIVLQ